MFEVEWTGSYPNRCSGEWVITKNGQRIELPEDLKKSPMGTFGTYSTWHFENWNEVFDDYDDGLDFDEWIVANPWAAEIAPTVPDQQELYLKISDKDWRHNSCGGCI